jgi:hypothetical protein
MDKNRIWVTGSVLVMVAVIALGWPIGIQPQLTARSAAEQQRITTAATNANHIALIAKLKNDFTVIGRLSAKLAQLDDSVPTGTEIPAFVNQLDALATKSTVTLAGFTVADAQPYTPVAAPVDAAAADPASTPGTGDEAAAAPAVPTPTPAAGVPPVTNGLITGDNFAALAVQITIKGTYAAALDYVNGLQTGKRLFLVTGLTTAKSTVETDPPGTVDATISGLVYVLVPPGTDPSPAPEPATASAAG